jgi:transcriptional regulator with XRE-family HTH domain
MHLENLRNVRRSRNLSQSQLGSRVGVQQPRVAMIEGGANVTRDTAERIARALLCDVADLVKPDEPTITLRLSEIPPQMLEMLTK